MPELFKRNSPDYSAKVGNDGHKISAPAMQKDTQPVLKYTTYRVRIVSTWYTRIWAAIVSFFTGRINPYARFSISVSGNPFRRNDIITMSKGDKILILNEENPLKVKRYSIAAKCI